MKNKEHHLKIKAIRTKEGLNMKISNRGFTDMEILGVLERLKLAVHKDIMDKQAELIKDK